jgi:plasmid stabilization system protein ParE
VKVRLSPRAEQRVRVVAKWWRNNRRASPTLFEDELHEVIELLKRQPTVGLEYANVRGKTVRRVLLPKSAQHVYYAVNAEAGLIVIYAVWGARRGRGPNL